jgi:hypothetical protein
MVHRCLRFIGQHRVVSSPFHITFFRGDTCVFRGGARAFRGYTCAFRGNISKERFTGITKNKVGEGIYRYFGLDGEKGVFSFG